MGFLMAFQTRVSPVGSLRASDRGACASRRPSDGPRQAPSRPYRGLDPYKILEGLLPGLGPHIVFQSIGPFMGLGTCEALEGRPNSLIAVSH